MTDLDQPANRPSLLTPLLVIVGVVLLAVGLLLVVVEPDPLPGSIVCGVGAGFVGIAVVRFRIARIVDRAAADTATATTTDTTATDPRP